MFELSCPPLPALRSSTRDLPLLAPLPVVLHAAEHRDDPDAVAFVGSQLVARDCWVAMHHAAGCPERAATLREEQEAVQRALEGEA